MDGCIGCRSVCGCCLTQLSCVEQRFEFEPTTYLCGYASSQGCVLVKWHDSVWDWLDIRLLIEFFLPLRTRGNSKWTSKWIISKERQHCRKDSYRRCAFSVECFVKIKNVHMIANKTINNIHSFFHLLFSEFTILGNLFASTQRYDAQRPIQRNNCREMSSMVLFCREQQ